MAATTVLTVNAPMAEAKPTGCSIHWSHWGSTGYNYPGYADAFCHSGTGHFRVFLSCQTVEKDHLVHFYRGNWAGKGGTSSKECPNKYRYLRSASIQKK